MIHGASRDSHVDILFYCVIFLEGVLTYPIKIIVICVICVIYVYSLIALVICMFDHAESFRECQGDEFYLELLGPFKMDLQYHISNRSINLKYSGITD